uniref:Uncharacterized protein n=1 Tax=Anguilla anguilla TaxID=7936 RepID=A0A0E9SW81_ANGAN
MHAEGTDMSVTQSGDVSEQVGCPVKRGPYGKHQFKFPARRMFYAFSFLNTDTDLNLSFSTTM